MKMRQTNNTCVIEPTIPCVLTVKIVFSNKVDILMHFYLDADHWSVLHTAFKSISAIGTSPTVNLVIKIQKPYGFFTFVQNR